MHLFQHHSAGPEHLCPDCGTSWKTQAGLEGHINKVHLKKTTDFCDICGTTFYHPREFRRHQERHRDQKLCCNHCGKSFTDRLRLRNHLRAEAKLKPYQCVHCNYTSERKGNLCLHVRKVHKKEWTNADVFVHKDILEQQNKQLSKDIAIILKLRAAAAGLIKPRLEAFQTSKDTS